MTRRCRVFSMCLLIALCAMLVSCGGEQPTSATNPPTAAQSEAQETPDSRFQLNFRITWAEYSGRGEAIAAITEQYNQTANVAVTLTGGNEDREELEALLNEPSDTVYVLPYRYIKYFGSRGLLADLTEAFSQEKDVFYDAIWSLATLDGKTYGIPWLGHSMCLLYNQNLLERAGVDAESIADMESFLSAIDTIHRKTATLGLGLVGAQSNDISWMVNQFIYGFGSALVSDDGTTVVINNEKAAEALRTYRDLLAAHAQPTWLNDTVAEVQTAFRNQKIAFEILGIWGVTDIMKAGNPFTVGVLPLSSIGLCSEVGPMMLAVPVNMSGEGKEAAYDFIRFMISKPAQEEIMKGEYSPEHDTYYPFRTPIRSDMADNHVFIDHPEYQYFVEGFENPSIDVPVPAWQIVKDEVYEAGLHQVMTGELTIEAFLSDVEQRGNSILGER